MLFDYETMGMRSIRWAAWSEHGIHHAIHHILLYLQSCVINYPGRPTNAISLLLFSSFIVVIGGHFFWNWISVLLRCCHGHCQIDYDLTGTAVSWLPVYSNGTRVFYALYGSNAESRFQLRVVQRFMLSFIRIGSRETKIWCGFLLHFHLQTGLVMVIFLSRRRFSFIVFLAQCSYISGGYLSFLSFVAFMLMSTCWVRWPEVSRHILFPFIICEEKEAVSFPSILSDLRAMSMFYCFFTYLISNLGGCLINYLSVVFWFYVVDGSILFYCCFRIAFAKLLLPDLMCFPSRVSLWGFSIGWLAVSF